MRIPDARTHLCSYRVKSLPSTAENLKARTEARVETRALPRCPTLVRSDTETLLVPVRPGQGAAHAPASQALVCIRSLSDARNEYDSALFEYAVDDPVAAPTEGNPIVVSETT